MVRLGLWLEYGLVKFRVSLALRSCGRVDCKLVRQIIGDTNVILVHFFIPLLQCNVVNKTFSKTKIKTASSASVISAVHYNVVNLPLGLGYVTRNFIN